MSLLKVTVEQVMSWEPCGPPDGPYTEEYVRKLFARRERVNALDILAMKIPAEDRLWAVFREELIPEPILYEFASWCEEWAIKRKRKVGRKPDSQSWSVAQNTVGDVTRSVAGKLAWGAARNSAGYVARVAAQATDRVTDRSAAWYAARDAANKTFIRKLKSMLREHGARRC